MNFKKLQLIRMINYLFPLTQVKMNIYVLSLTLLTTVRFFTV